MTGSIKGYRFRSVTLLLGLLAIHNGLDLAADGPDSAKGTDPTQEGLHEKPAEKEQPGPNSRQAKYVLRLYVSGSTSKSALAVENIKRICEQYLKSRYDLEVIDIYQQPNLARVEQIVAVPTLVKRLPPPLRRLIGDLSNTKRVLFGLELGLPSCKTNTDKSFSPRPTRESAWGRYPGSA